MSSLVNFSLCLSDLPSDKIVVAKNKKKYLNLTMSINDETKFGNNAGIFVSQTQEERTDKASKSYVGNGKVVWTDGSIVKAELDQKEQPKSSIAQDDDDLPF